MEKLYNRIIFVNDSAPALNETNLNKMSKALDDIDDRVIDLASDIMIEIPQVIEDIEHIQDLLDDAEDLKDSCSEYASSARSSSLDAKADSELSEKWAVGTSEGTPVPSTDPTYHNNSKYWAEQAQSLGQAEVANCQDEVKNAEAYAIGTRAGTPVASTDPAYHNNSKYYAETSSENAESWAIGTRGGVPVPSTDPAYHNNAKYWAENTNWTIADDQWAEIVAILS